MFTDLLTAFTLGLLTPLTAVCVLPLYPGFLSYLSSQMTQKKDELSPPEPKSPFIFGIFITLGVLVFMFLLGIIFTTIFQISLTKVIGIVSPIAFGILGLISLGLIFDLDFSRFLPKTQAPLTKNPLVSSFLFGFFFGAIVIPCNPLLIAALFAKTATVMGFVTNMLSFLFFGLGIAAPLLFFSIISAGKSNIIIRFLVKYKKVINFLTGITMLGISIYYLVFVFRIFQ